MRRRRHVFIAGFSKNLISPSHTQVVKTLSVAHTWDVHREGRRWRRRWRRRRWRELGEGGGGGEGWQFLAGFSKNLMFKSVFKTHTHTL